MRKLLLLLLWCLPALAANTVYIAPSAAGSANGSSCANAYASSYFNTSGNWTSGTPTGTQIGPGTVVHVCAGTYTVSTSGIGLQFQGSGSSGNVIELLGDSGGSGVNFTSAAAGAFIDINSKSYILIDGGTACGRGSACSSNYLSSSTAGTMILQNTLNGTSGATCSGGSCSQQVSSFGVHAGYNSGSPYGTCGSNIEVRNLIIANMYVRNGAVDDSTPLQNYYPGNTQFVGCGANISQHDITATNGHTGFGALTSGSLSPANYQFYNNVFVGGVWGVNTENGSGVASGFYIYNNDINLGATWSQTGDSNPFHLDGIIVYGQSGSVYPENVFIYNNYLHGNWSSGQSNACPTGFIFLDQNVTNAYVFNNVLYITGAYACNGMVAMGPANNSNYILNNTFVGYSNSEAQALGSLGVSSPLDFLTVENNIFSTLNGVTDMRDACSGQAGTCTAVATENYNDFYNMSGSSSPGVWCPGTSSGYCFINSFSTWQACSGCTNSGAPDANSITSSPNLNSSYVPNSGSPVIGAAANLYSFASCASPTIPGLGALCSDAAGNARPTSGNWDMGAYEYSSGSTYSITVTSPSNGSVVDSQSLISCPSTCSTSSASGPDTLTAVPNSSYTYGSWGGGTCSGSDATPCTVSATASVTASFTATPVSAPGSLMANVLQTWFAGIGQP